MSMITSKVGGIFIPVSNIIKAREWYSALLEVEPIFEIIVGHLCCIPMDNSGLNIILDSKIYHEDAYARTPMFHFNTDDIHTAYEFMKEKGVEIITEIEHGHSFNFKDPDGNMLMICQLK